MPLQPLKRRTTHSGFSHLETHMVSPQLARMEQEIEAFIRFLAVERGLSENYQLSTQRSLTEFAQWCASKKKI
ncbi:MAG TPA: hypothetical protein DIT76_02250, partial [Spartobacteria bacterium]|nr:hypothetical protein [Spartobacteria bacterium]